MKRTIVVTGIATCMLALAAAVAVPATAAPLEGAVIAEDTTPAPTVAPDATLVGVDANVVGGLTVRGHQGKPVTVSTKGEKPRTAVARASSPAVFRNLTAGKSYAVSIGGQRIGTATPVSKPGAAYGLKVATTSTPDGVRLTWSQQAKRSAGKVTYQVTATPDGVNQRSGKTVAPMSLTSSVTQAEITGLDPNTLYTFTITPTNTAASGRASSASMTKTLAELTGTEVTADVTPVPEVPAPTPPTPAPAPAPAPGGGGAPAPSAPSTRTIYVCPDGFSEIAGQCQTTRPYTFHTETQRQSYTYTWTKTGTRRNTTNEVCNYLPNPSSPTGLDIYCTGAYDEDVYSNVKDATPAGWTDNGSAWVKDVQVKDAAPAGYSDNGSEWVKTADKVAQVVPA